MSENRIILGLTDYGTVAGDFMWALLRYLAYDGQHRQLHAGSVRKAGVYVDDNRNAVVAEYLAKSTAEWLLMLDADHDPEPDVPYRLLDAADPVERPIMSALYFGFMKTNLRTGGLAPVWMKRYKHGYRTLFHDDVKLEEEITPLDAVGMGCCLIHRSVFEKMAEAPNFDRLQWFGRQIIDHEDNVIGRYGEDVAFCWRAQQSGFKIHGHGGVVVDHLKTRRENHWTFLERLQNGKQAAV